MDFRFLILDLRLRGFATDVVRLRSLIAAAWAMAAGNWVHSWSLGRRDCGWGIRSGSELLRTRCGCESPPAGAYWRAAKSVPRRNGGLPFVRVEIKPPRPVGAHTKLRFRYHLAGASGLTVQIFDASVQDNRHIQLRGLKQNEWTTTYLDFTRDSRRNDGTITGGFAAGNLVDDLFFFVEGEGAATATLFVDEVVLFDAGGNPL